MADSTKENIVTLGTSTKSLRKPWQKCIAGPHAYLGLRADYQNHMKMMHDELGFEYVRLHGILDDDMCTMLLPNPNIPKQLAFTSFHNVDVLYDAILEIGLKPWVELSHMPTPLASGDLTWSYFKSNVSPPSSYERWGAFIAQFVQHLCDRYGVEEVSTWFFEVWNEPNLPAFFSGTTEDYFQMYQYAANAVKGVSPRFRVGGPSTSHNLWIPELITFCIEKSVPLDFISTHHYATKEGFGVDLDGAKEAQQKIYMIMQEAMRTGKGMERIQDIMDDQIQQSMHRAGRDILKDQALQARKEAGDLPLMYTEWNCNPLDGSVLHDTEYNAAFLVKTAIDQRDTVESYSFWSISDIYDEGGQKSLPFHGGFGLVNINGIPKPSYWAFFLLNQMKGEELEINLNCASQTVGAIATKSSSEICILIWNHQIPLDAIETETINIQIPKFGDIFEIFKKQVDEDNCNPRDLWEKMGSPDFLTKTQVDEIKSNSEIKRDSVQYDVENDFISIDLTIKPHGVTLLTIRVD